MEVSNGQAIGGRGYFLCLAWEPELRDICDFLVRLVGAKVESARSRAPWLHVKVQLHKLPRSRNDASGHGRLVNLSLRDWKLGMLVGDNETKE